MGSWATPWVTKLMAGETVKFRPRGNSMGTYIESGQLVTLVPVRYPSALAVDTIVLCKVNGSYFLHFIKAIDQPRAGGPPRFQIGNAHGHINGWTSANNIFGKLIKVED